MSRRPFDAFEIHVVGHFHQPGMDEGYEETIDTLAEFNESRDEALSFYFTTYGYRKHLEPDIDGGLQAIADFEFYEDALDLALALAATPDGTSIVNMVPGGLEGLNKPAVVIQ